MTTHGSPRVMGLVRLPLEGNARPWESEDELRGGNLLRRVASVVARPESWESLKYPTMTEDTMKSHGPGAMTYERQTLQVGGANSAVQKPTLEAIHVTGEKCELADGAGAWAGLPGRSETFANGNTRPASRIELMGASLTNERHSPRASSVIIVLPAGTEGNIEVADVDRVSDVEAALRTTQDGKMEGAARVTPPQDQRQGAAGGAPCPVLPPAEHRSAGEGEAPDADRQPSAWGGLPQGLEVFADDNIQPGRWSEREIALRPALPPEQPVPEDREILIVCKRECERAVQELSSDPRRRDSRGQAARRDSTTRK